MKRCAREGLEFQVSKPEAITKVVDGVVYEPYERVIIETPAEYVGIIAEEMASRLGRVEDMQNDGNGRMRVAYMLPTRGLIGFRSFLLRATRGNANMNSELLPPQPMKGEVKSTRFGVLVASEPGIALTYGIKNAQERGQTFIVPQTPVYEGMLVGMHNRDKDLDLNICKERKMSNMRSATSDIVERLETAIRFSLEEALDFVANDELVEITPSNIRLRKRVLKANERHRMVRSRSRD